MLNILKNLIKKDFKIIVRHRGALAASMCLPFLLYGIFAFSFSGMMKREADISPVTLGIVDKENSTISRMLINNFKGNKSFSDMIKIEVMDEKEATEEFKENKLTGFIIIPADFSRSLIYIENYPLKVYLNKNEPLKSSVIKNMMESYSIYISSVEKSIVAMMQYLDNKGLSSEELDSINQKASLDLVLTALSRGNIFEEKSLNTIPAATSQEYFLIAILVLLFMYNGVTAGSDIIKEVNSGAIRRQVAIPYAVPLTPIAKGLSYIFFGIIQTLIFILPLAYFAGLWDINFIVNIVLFISTATAFIISLFICIAAFFNREELYIIAGNIFVFVCGIAGGSFLPLQLMPAEVQKLAAFTPNYWIIKGGVYLTNYFPLSSIKDIMLSFIALAVVFFAAASIKINRGVRRG